MLESHDAKDRAWAAYIAGERDLAEYAPARYRTRLCDVGIGPARYHARF
jgi:hypothetical protein